MKILSVLCSKSAPFIGALLALIVSACGETKEQESFSSPRVRKLTKVESPESNAQFTRGTSVPFVVAASASTSIDSVQATVEGFQTSFAGTGSFKLDLPTRRVGKWKVRLKVYCGTKSETHYRTIVVLPEHAPQQMTYEVVNTYPHNTEDYTQGLLMKDGFLYESTGQKGHSTFKKKDLTSGQDLQVVNLDDQYFGEGLALFNNEFYQLTWRSNVGFVYNMEMEQVRTFTYDTEGWGITTIGEVLVMTDESEKLYFMDPASFTETRKLEAYTDEGLVDSLNEMEYIDGKIYANVYQEDIVVVIDPTTGEVLQQIDFSGILPAEDQKGVDVLNGIAYDDTNGKIYVTGKWWPKLFEVLIKPKDVQ